MIKDIREKWIGDLVNHFTWNRGIAEKFVDNKLLSTVIGEEEVRTIECRKWKEVTIEDLIKRFSND